jgi:hypothetical protein
LPWVDAEHVEEPERCGLGDDGGSCPVPGMIFMVASASRMSLPVGMAGRPAYRPSTLVLSCSARACLAWRSIRQKMSRARQMTVTRAAMRRLLLQNRAATARGPLKAE